MFDFTFHTDPGHGWLEVSREALQALGMKPADFSRFSYRKGDLFFLEEDCDASKFIAAWMAKHGRKPQFRELHLERTFIRDLPSIH